ncbi:MetQ/NlpA family ABC transporter substrate-binding protein, partial [Sulfitobacter pontiacus]
MLRIATLTSTLALMATSLMAEQIKVGVSPGEHAEIMEEVARVAEPMGLEIDVVEFSDYVVPNQALADGDI